MKNEDARGFPAGNVYRGIGVSPGVVIGPVHRVMAEAMKVVERTIDSPDVDREVMRFEDAIIETRRQLTEIQNDIKEAAGSGGGFLDAHMMVLEDRVFIEEILTGIRQGRRNAEVVVKQTAERYVQILGGVEDGYLRERVADVKDVCRRIILNLTGGAGELREEIQHKHVIVAVDLAPSETASLRKDMVIGFATDMGSPTSHTAVMARALGIPTVVGLGDITEHVATGDEILVDGNKGILIVKPTPEQVAEYGRVAEARKTIQRELVTLKNEPAETRDGHRITLSANVEDPGEIDAVLQYGAEGVGLFRSEYLFLSRNRVVSEDEQKAAYETVASRLAPATVIIRTLDLGGDKFFPGANLPTEANPFLGCRSIRLSLMYPDQLKSQLKAILGASTHRNVKIMYPMVSNVGEVEQANEILEECKNDLVTQGIPFDRAIEVGAMIEIPSAALTADAIAEHVRFFSLGTNDLIQYSIAVDRLNEKVAYLYEPTHPAILRLIRMTVEAAHRRGIWAGVCGEMAADPVMTALLVGLGIDELSVTPVAVPLVKDAVRSISYREARALADEVMACRTAVEVLGHCRKLVRECAPEILELV